jgi:PAS domain S-box-containing protein
MQELSGFSATDRQAGPDADIRTTSGATPLDSEQQLRRIVDTVPVAIWSFTSDGQVTYVSPQNREHLGVSNLGFEDFATLSAAVVHPDDRPITLAARTEAFRTGSAFTVRYRRLVNGAYRWTEGRAAPLRDEAGNIIHWYAVSMDVDDEVRAVEALRRSEQQLRRLVDALPTQIWATDPDGEPSYINRRLSEFVGLTLDDLDLPNATRLQAAIQGSVHPDDAEAVATALAQAFATGEPFAMKYRQRRADGIYRWISGRAEPLRDAKGTIQQWYGVSFDIDDDVRTQEELRRTQERLAAASQAASLAELSASIAHEVNQPLAAVVANAHASQRWLDTDPPNFERARAAVDRVVRDANGAADVVGRIRALFRQSRAGRVATRLDGIVAEARALLAEEASQRRVRIETWFDPRLPPVPMDRVQIQQVLINLMRNGIEAMAPTSGERVLTLAIRRIVGAVEIEVTDTGPGIAQPERMFEPFFTTKQHGMGMGLAISRSIVESHGGRLWAGTNELQGGRLCFTLPVETTNE